MTIRARIRLARGDLDGAVDDASAIVELADGIKDPQVLYPARAGAARVFQAAGRSGDGDRLR